MSKRKKLAKIEKKKLKIVSDGTLQGTFVKDQEDNVVDNVTYISWTADIERNEVTATIHLENIKLEVENETTVQDLKEPE